MLSDIIHAEGVRLPCHHPGRRRVTCSTRYMRWFSRSANQELPRRRFGCDLTGGKRPCAAVKAHPPGVVLGHFCRAKYGNFSRVLKDKGCQLIPPRIFTNPAVPFYQFLATSILRRPA